MVTLVKKKREYAITLELVVPNTSNQPDRTHSYCFLKEFRPSGFCQLSLLAQGAQAWFP